MTTPIVRGPWQAELMFAKWRARGYPENTLPLQITPPGDGADVAQPAEQLIRNQ
jgi:hypothetical protein